MLVLFPVLRNPRIFPILVLFPIFIQTYSNWYFGDTRLFREIQGSLPTVSWTDPPSELHRLGPATVGFSKPAGDPLVHPSMVVHPTMDVKPPHIEKKTSSNYKQTLRLRLGVFQGWSDCWICSVCFFMLHYTNIQGATWVSNFISKLNLEGLSRI